MSQHYYLKKDKYGAWKYKNRSYRYSGWNNFTNSETDLPSIKKFLQQSSDSVSVEFVTDDLRPANYFEIRKGDKHIDVIMNGGDSTFRMFDHNFLPVQEQELFFQSRLPEEIVQKADQYQNHTKVQFYKDNASPDTLTEYNQMVKGLMTDDAIRQKLATYDPDKVSEIYFQE